MSRLKTPNANARRLSQSVKSKLVLVNTDSIVGFVISRLHHQLAWKYQGPVKHKYNQHEMHRSADFKLLRLAFCALLVVLMNFAFMPATQSMPLINPPRGQSLDERLSPTSNALDQERYQDTIDSACALIDKRCLNEQSLGYAYCLRGIARSFLAQFDEAVEDIDRGLQINPNIDGKDELYGIRATSLYKTGRYKEAIASINQSLSIAPSGMAWRLRGMAYFRLKKHDAAIKDLYQALAYPDCPDDTRALIHQIAHDFPPIKPSLQLSKQSATKRRPCIRTPARSSSEYVCHVNVPKKTSN